MTTGWMRSTLEPEHRLTTQDSKHYQEALDSLEDRKSGMTEEEDEEEDDALGPQHLEDDQLKKPRRKDTPVLNCPPHIPGVRLMKGEKQMIHSEDEEKNVKD
ncbi:protein phosphatase 1 regulatory subunit 17 [Myripristis murdjan]|uniref:protein phosphatase 1 regulatory subunit 17 n=1 Tax=Myripristis murdjan TaxID=586833 RepID=UPI001175E4F5|nr:protein phosphatase 1 regulatory subunit 17 [Myripristis murdjan]